MSNILNTITKWLTSHSFVSYETYVFCLFTVFQIFISTNKVYVVLVIIYACGLYLISKNLLKTAWYTFLSTLLFRQAKYFISVIAIPNGSTFLELQVLYNIMFSDIVLLGVLYLLNRHIHTKTGALVIFEYLFIPIVVIGFVSSWLSYFPNISLFYVIQILKYFLIYLTARIVMTNPEIKKVTIEIVCIFLLFNGLLMTIQQFRGGPLGIPIEHANSWSTLGRYAVELKDIYRPGGTMDDPNLIGSFIGMILPLLLVVSVSKSVFNNKFILVVLAASVVGLVFSGSRAVWFIMLFLAGGGLYMSKRILKRVLIPFRLDLKNKIRVFLLLSVLIPFIILRLSTIGVAFSDNGSGVYRLKHITIAWKYILEYPFGIGAHVFKYLTPTRFEPDAYSYIIAEPHNIFAQIGSELGIFGLLLFCLLFFSIIARKYRFIKKRKDALDAGIFLGCISYLVISCFYPWFLYPPLSEIFWLFMGTGTYDT